jgi:type II secretory ATPase GspE/PulE/Tfp pilus assembly ATPase PilB-like protein/transcriptional regulator with GAF, ATPase, and Fis domain
MTSSNFNAPAIENDNSNGKGEFDSFASQVRNIDLTNTSLNSLTDSLKNIFDCEAAALFTYDHSKKNLSTQILSPEGKGEVCVDISENNLVGYVAGAGKPINVHNVHSMEELERFHKKLKNDSSVDESLNIATRSAMLIPLPHKNKLVGVMEIINKNDGKPFPEADFIKAKAVSLVIGLALVKIGEREYKNGASSQAPIVDRSKRLNDLFEAIPNVKNPNAIYSDLKQPLIKAFDAGAVVLFAVDRKKNEVVSKLNWNPYKQDIKLPINHSNIAGFSVANNQWLNIMDVSDINELNLHHQNLQFDGSWELNSSFKTKSLLTIPFSQSNKLIGVLQLVNKRSGSGFDAQDEEDALKVSELLAQTFHKMKIYTEAEPTKFSYLIDNDFLTEDELGQVISKANDTHSDVETLLIKDLYLRALDVGKSLESFYDVPFTGYDETIVLPDLEGFDIDHKILRNQFWVPLKVEDSRVAVLVNDPSDSNTIEEIKKVFLQQDVDIRVGLKLDIQKYINNFYGAEEVAESTETKVIQGDNKLELTISEEYPAVKTEQQNPNADSTGQFFDEIISIAIQQGVTDIHIEPGMDGKNLLVRLRKEGACRVFEEIPADFQQEIISHIKTRAHLDPSINKLPQNGKFIWSLGPNRYELNVVIFPTIGDLEDAMIRVSPIGKRIPGFMSMTDMEFSDPNLDKIMSRIHAAKGMILIVGPEGTGKTTSLHALLNHLNTSDKKIVTAENPVDIVQNGLRQLQMNEENGLNYALALETFLLGNPDIIMVGEIDNDATLKLCVQAAQQRLIFTSLKAKSTIDAIRKMREMNIDANQFSDAVVLVMAQKLVPSLCEHCKEDYHPSQDEFDMLEKFYGDKNFSELGFQYNDNLTLKKAVGCKQCIFTGYSGQIALQEVLERTPELNRLIAENAPMEEIHNQALNDGMITLNQDGIYKIMNGDCDFKKIQEAFLPGRF